MNIRVAAIALLGGLIYEILLKLCLFKFPEVIQHPPMPGIFAVLSLLVGAVLLVFLLSFAQQTTSRPLRIMVWLIIACIIVHAFLRMLQSSSGVGFNPLRMVESAFGLIQTVLILAALVLYRPLIPAKATALRRTTTALIMLFGFGAMKSLMALFNFLRFSLSGFSAEPSPVFAAFFALLFLLTHATLIYFLYSFYRLSSRSGV